jgi:Ca2+-binding EF-hand superfamily protein
MSKGVLLLMLAAASAAFLSAGPQEAKPVDELFAKLDENKDEKLSEAEFDRLFEIAGKANTPAQEKRNEFKAWDADGDAFVSKSEFQAKHVSVPIRP